jgi:two-component system, LytTR family, response regulator
LKSIRTIIADDEPPSIEVLTALCQTYCPEIELICVCTNGKEAIEAIKKHKPQLVFLDVEMPFYTGFQVLEQLGAIDFPVIFTTAHSKYAVQAFRISATNFLQKPIDELDFQNAMNNLKNSGFLKPTADQLTLLQQTWRNSKEDLKKLPLPIAAGLVFVEIDNIIYCQSEGNYVTLFLSNGKSLLITRGLKDIEELLETKPFFRIHNSYLINLNCIEQYHRGEGGHVVLSNTTVLPVSKSKKDVFLEIFKQ